MPNRRDRGQENVPWSSPCGALPSWLCSRPYRPLPGTTRGTGRRAALAIQGSTPARGCHSAAVPRHAACATRHAAWGVGDVVAAGLGPGGAHAGAPGACTLDRAGGGNMRRHGCARGAAGSALDARPGGDAADRGLPAQLVLPKLLRRFRAWRSGRVGPLVDGAGRGTVAGPQAPASPDPTRPDGRGQTPKRGAYPRLATATPTAATTIPATCTPVSASPNSR